MPSVVTAIIADYSAGQTCDVAIKVQFIYYANTAIFHI